MEYSSKKWTGELCFECEKLFRKKFTAKNYGNETTYIAPASQNVRLQKKKLRLVSSMSR